MLISSGWGTVVIGMAALPIVAGALLSALLDLPSGAAAILSTALLVPAGIATWFVGKWLNRFAKRELVDPRTGEIVVIGSYHSLYFVPVEWWGPIMAVVGIALLAAMVASPSA